MKKAGSPAFALKLDFTPATGRLTRNRRSSSACASTEAGTILELLLFLSLDEDFGRCCAYSIAHLQGEQLIICSMNVSLQKSPALSHLL